MTKVTIEAQISELARELRLRENVYPGFVARGKMRQAEADLHVVRLTAALETLKWVREHRDELVAIHDASPPPTADPA